MSDPRVPNMDEDVIEAPDLPALPDGGLGASMPSWLRQAPSFAAVPAETASPPATFDPASLTRGLELPEWLGELSARVDRPPAEISKARAQELPVQPSAIVHSEPEPEPASELAVEPGVTSTVAPSLKPVPEITRPNVATHLPKSSEPEVEPSYRAIALLVFVVAAALLFIAIWASLT